MIGDSCWDVSLEHSYWKLDGASTEIPKAKNNLDTKKKVKGQENDIVVVDNLTWKSLESSQLRKCSQS